MGSGGVRQGGVVVMAGQVGVKPFELKSLDDKVEIAPDVEMNRLGVGTFRAADGPEVANEVRWALEIGYRSIDTAKLYENEDSIGRVLAETDIPRDQLFVATKVWNNDQGYDSTLRAFEASRRRLGLEYVDLYLIHWPEPALTRDTWRAMEHIRAEGLVRAIGVCNFMPRDLDELFANAEVPPAIDQVELHPLRQRLDVRRYCAERGITVQAWAPVMRGMAAGVPELAETARRHGKTAAQVSIRWILQSSITTIPKSVHRDRLVENADVYDFELTPDEMAEIDALDQDQSVSRRR